MREDMSDVIPWDLGVAKGSPSPGHGQGYVRLERHYGLEEGD